ncbi:MAG: hypothetical protein AAGH15_09215, partial [Myxococcota bacterium]
MDGGSHAPAGGNVTARRARRVRSRRRLRVGLAVLLLPPAVAVGASQTHWGEARLARIAEGLLRDELGLETELADLQVTWGAWPPSLTLRAEGIELRHPTAGPLADADALTLRPSLGAVLQGKIDLQTIELLRPTLRIVVDESGIANGPTLPEGGPGPPELPFERLRIEGGIVSIEAEPAATLRLEGVELDLGARSSRSGLALDVVLDAVGGSLAHAEGIEPVQRVHATARVEIGDEDLSVEADRITLRTPYAALSVTDGTLLQEGDAPPSWAGHVAARLELARLARLPLGEELPAMGGRLSFEGDIAGDDRLPPTGEGRLVLERGTLKRRFVLGERIDLRIRAEPDAIAIVEGSELVLPSGGGRADVRGSLGLGDDLPVDLTLDLEEVTLASIMEVVGQDANIMTHWPMTGRARLRGTLAPFDMGGPVNLVTEGFRVTMDPHHVRPRSTVIAVPRTELRGRWDFSEDALVFTRLVVESARSRLLASVVHLGFDDRFEALISGERFDLADVSPLIDIPLAGAGPLDVKITGGYDEPKITGHARIADFRFDEMPGGDVESDFELLPGYQSVRFPVVDAVKNESRYRVHELVLAFESGGRFSLDGDLELQRVSLADAYHAFRLHEDERFTEYQGRARGRMSLRYTQGFPNDGPNGTFVTRMDLVFPELEASGIAFTDGHLAGRFRWLDYTQGLDGGELEVEHFELRKGAGRVSVEGNVAVGGAVRVSVAADHLALSELEPVMDLGVAGSYAV